MPTSPHSTGSLFEDELPCSLEDSPVRTSVPPARARGSSKASVVPSGLMLFELSESADLPFCLLRTYLASELSGLTGFCKTWQRQVTPQRRSWWVLTTLGPVTGENASGSWPSEWKTPDTAAGGQKALLRQGITKREDGSKIQERLLSQVQRWPTPTEHGSHNRAGLSPTSGDGISTAAKAWPTPTVQDGSNVAGQSQEERNSPPLNAAARQWPTPKKQCANSPGIHGQGGLEIQTTAAQWPTPRANKPEGYSSPQFRPELAETALQSWPTPTASQNGNRNTKPSPAEINGTHGLKLGSVAGEWGSSHPAPEQTGAESPQSSGLSSRLNPKFVCWLQGYPPTWFDGVEMPAKERRSSKGSGTP